MLSTGTTAQNWTICWVTAIAILTAQLFPHQSTGYLPIYSELLCWTLLTIIFTLVSRYQINTWEHHDTRYHDPKSRLLWMAAVSVSVAVLSSSFGDVTWITPAIASLLLVLRCTSLLPQLHKSQAACFQSTWLPVGLGMVSVVILAPTYAPSNLVLVGLALSALTGLYGSLIHIFEPKTELRNEHAHSNAVSNMRAIAIRTVPLLLVEAALMTTVLLPGRTVNLLHCVGAGILKAAHWLCALWLANRVPWEIAPAIWTYTAAVHGCFTLNTIRFYGFLQTLTRLAVALLSMHQIVSLLPKTVRGRYLLMILAVWPTLSLIQYTPLDGLIPLLSANGGDQNLYETQAGPTPHHPIEELATKAKEYLEALSERQSRTLDMAEIEYRRRYGRKPPPGFDKWFAYAQSKQSVLIDDFDMINDDLRPFWSVPADRLHGSIDYVTRLDILALRKCGFTNGAFQGQGDAWIVNNFGELLQEVSKDLPNVTFAFDVVDEPRVVITQQMLDAGGVAKPEFQDVSHTSTWARVTGPCQSRTSKSPHLMVHDYGLSFVQDWYFAKDVCQHPEFENLHGFFTSPATALLTDAPIPVLSQAAPTSFGDIMYPSPWYTAKLKQGDYKDAEDPPWHKKADTLYWAGSTTGSYSTNSSWKNSHRQRFVELVDSLADTNREYLKQMRPGIWGSYEAAEDHRDLFNAKLTAIIQCDDKDCDEQKSFFNVSDKEERSQQFASKFVFDIDGNSFSGRYYTLLQSRSVVLKQTVLREWHDERLIPWVHFVPVSLSMEELPEIMRYMTSDETGRRIAKEIADAGKEWHAKVLRPEDFTIYLYRLMLELARVMDPSRHAE